MLLICATLFGSSAKAQTLPPDGQRLLDSLRTNEKNTIYVIVSFCPGCGKIVGERGPRGKNISCAFNEEYWMLWSSEGSNEFQSVFSNGCYIWDKTPEDDPNLPTYFQELFSKSFPDSTVNQQDFSATNTLKMSSPNSSDYYRIYNYQGTNERSVLFSGFALNNHISAHPEELEAELYCLLQHFNEGLFRLDQEGQRNESAWDKK